jgi:hypothetical protein
MSIGAAYIKAMIAGRDGECGRIEQAHGLYGYPPEIVSVGLAAVDEGRDASQAIDDYINGAGA